MAISSRTAILTIACLLAVTIPARAQRVYNQYQDYQQDYQQGYQQQYPQQVVQQQPQIAEKVTGYDAQDVIPQGGSPLKSPDQSQGNQQYVDFINKLYRFDRTKPALQFESGNGRQKRALVFRPMFVYKQQKVRREKVKAEKQASSVPANQSPHYKDKDNHVYREYNSFYDPYRYGQRYPYQNN